MKNNDHHRKTRAVIGLMFILFQVILFINADSVGSIEAFIKNDEIKTIIYHIAIGAIGPLMSIEIISHYSWGIDPEIFIMLAISWVPAIILYLGLAEQPLTF